MSDSASWWANKVGSQQPQRQGFPTPVRDTRPVERYEAPTQQPPQSQAPQAIDTSQINVTPENLFEAVKLWQGGQGTKQETENCPECGSNQYYSRTNGIRRGPPPAPHCFQCGYNGGLFDRQGDPSNWNYSG